MSKNVLFLGGPWNGESQLLSDDAEYPPEIIRDGWQNGRRVNFRYKRCAHALYSFKERNFLEEEPSTSMAEIAIANFIGGPWDGEQKLVNAPLTTLHSGNKKYVRSGPFEYTYEQPGVGIIIYEDAKSEPEPNEQLQFDFML